MTLPSGSCCGLLEDVIQRLCTPIRRPLHRPWGERPGVHMCGAQSVHFLCQLTIALQSLLNGFPAR